MGTSHPGQQHSLLSAGSSAASNKQQRGGGALLKHDSHGMACFLRNAARHEARLLDPTAVAAKVKRIRSF